MIHKWGQKSQQVNLNFLHSMPIHAIHFDPSQDWSHDIPQYKWWHCLYLNLTMLCTKLCTSFAYWQSIRRQFATTSCRISDLCLLSQASVSGNANVFFLLSLCICAYVWCIRMCILCVCVCVVCVLWFAVISCHSHAKHARTPHMTTQTHERDMILCDVNRETRRKHTVQNSTGTHHIQSTHPQTCHTCHACPCCCCLPPSSSSLSSHQTHVYRSMNACDKQL